MNATPGGWLRKALKTFLINIGVLLRSLCCDRAWPPYRVWRAKSAVEQRPSPDPNAAYTHTFKVKFDGFDKWFRGDYPLRTNSLGFKDATTRDVPLVADRKRIVFIGDFSFTEGLGLTYEESFVGRFAATFPDIDVLNAGVSSYAPSAYYQKIKFLLENGLRFDEAIVYIDISDIQDEAVSYAYDANGVLHWKYEMRPEDGHSCAPIMEPDKKWWEKAFYVVDFFSRLQQSKQVLNALDHASLQDLIDNRLAFYRDYDRAAWTDLTVVDCYGDLGVEGAIEKAKRQMDRLYEVLSQYGVPLSVGVYPWPKPTFSRPGEFAAGPDLARLVRGEMQTILQSLSGVLPLQGTRPRLHQEPLHMGDVHFNARGCSSSR